MKNAISSHAGNPHSSTLRKPGLYTARTRATAANIQNISLPLPTEQRSHRGGLAIRDCIGSRRSGLRHRSGSRGLPGIAEVDWLTRRFDYLSLRDSVDGRRRYVVTGLLLLHGMHHLHALLKCQWLRCATGQQKRDRNQRFHDDSLVGAITSRLATTVQTEVT